MTTDLILPLVSLFSLALAALVLLIVRRKSDVLSKRMALYLLAGLAVAAGIGASLARIESVTTAFYWLEGLVLVLGVGHLVLARSQFSWIHTAPVSDELSLLMLTAALLAMAQTLAYGLLRPSGTFLPAVALGWLPFFLPTLFMLAYEAFAKIPARVYRKWFYPVDREVPLIELVDTIRLHVQVSKKPDQPQLTTYTVKAPIDRSLHDLFHYMIYSHNNEEDPENPIEYHEVDTEGSLLGWVFYRPKLGGFLKHYLDPSLSLSRSKLTSDTIIVARSYVSSIQK
ncbi:TssN family type VI secretion system protein [uncultured Fibrella sp.]|uniref:TssN family type VI secretion system protein n=1 Tax=uncultured Fibrella sp. TaxID=1284596 RepID=UPI0035CBBD32